MSQNPDGQDDNPVAGLAGLEGEDVSSTFLDNVRKKIHRRGAGSQFASFTWNMPQVVLFEFLNMFAELFKRSANRKGNSSERETR